MSLKKKILLAIGLVLLVVLAGAAIFIATSGPTLPPDTDEIIDQVMAAELPEIFKGETGLANSDGVDIWYESSKPEGASKGAVLLFTGISSDASAWPPLFLDAMVNGGYQVIRHDPRGTGLSDWMEDWDSSSPYSLDDMADDGIAVLDALGVEKAHVVGVSMGGMIAQQMVINHPDRTLSLTSIMSSCNINDPNLPPISIDLAKELVLVGIKYGLIGTERNLIKLQVAGRLLLMGETSYDFDVKTIAEQVLTNIRHRKGYNSQVSQQHQAAVTVSGSRYDELRTLEVPSLIIHGKSDPFIPIAHGMRCAEVIHDADSLWIDGMGHDLPDEFNDVVVTKMLENFHQVDVMAFGNR